MKRILCLLFSWLVLVQSFVFAQQKKDVLQDTDKLEYVSILHEGRIKPLDTFARNLLLRFSSRQTYQKTPAIRWLSKLLFDPELTKEDKIFLINHPQIVETLGIEKQEKRRYSFSQLQPKFEKIAELATAAQRIKNEDRDIVENELIRIFENMLLYSKLSLSFAFVKPHEDFALTDVTVKNQLGLNPEQELFSFLDLALTADQLQLLIRDLEVLPQDQWTFAQRELMTTTSNMFQWSMFYQDLPLHIISPSVTRQEVWLSPWDALPIALQSEEGRALYTSLKNIVYAYENNEKISFDLNVKEFITLNKSNVSATQMEEIKRNPIEVLFNGLNLLFYAKVLYFLTFLVFLLNFLINKGFVKTLAWCLSIPAFLMHTTAIVMRIIILNRPPVSNLYETFVFVGFAAVLVSLLIERLNKQWLGLVTSSICGFIFLTIAAKFSTDGDTLQKLVAVLNSNFWLSTHVLSITIGYAGVCVAGIVGHIYMLQTCFKSNDKELLQKTYRVLIGTLGFGLTMTFLGTNLGGVWADQSWGRFWGWDPKENGALMIILWTALLFHAKIAKIIGPLGLAVGSVLGIIVVMWAWFGVNLLSIGLHSYGFTTGLATNLAIYTFLQILFVIIFYPMAKKRFLK